MTRDARNAPGTDTGSVPEGQQGISTAIDIRRFALTAHHLGLCVVPPKQDGSKQPLGSWKHYQTERPSREQVAQWYRNGNRTGFGFLTGQVSDNLEMFEFEGRAVASGLYDDFLEAIEAAGLVDEWHRIESSYMEESPSGGYHFLWRCDEIERSQKLARQADAEVLIETKGEGGYTIAAPSNGSVHPTGKPWRLLDGSIETIPTIDPEIRRQILTIARGFDESQRDEDPRPNAPATLVDNSDAPGALYNGSPDVINRTVEVLTGHGWTVHSRGEHGTIYLRRPNREPHKKGASASLGHPRTGGGFYVFSTAVAEFDEGRRYSPFAVYAILEHGGDFSAAARQLSDEGFNNNGEITIGSGGTNDDENTTIDSTANGSTIADLLEEEIEEIRWAVADLFPEGMVVLGGKPKVGKSWLVIALAIAVAGGREVLEGYQTEPAGRVLHIAYEDGKRRLQDRYRKVGGLTHEAARRIEYRTDWPTLGNGGIETLDEWLTDHPDARLVVIDTWGRFSADHEVRGKTTYQADYEMGGKIHKIARDHRVAVIIVTHVRQMPAEDWMDRIQGTNGIVGAADTVAALFRERGQHDAALKIIGRDMDEIEMALGFESFRWNNLGDPEVWRASKERREVYEAVRRLLHELGAESVKVSIVHEEVGGNRSIANTSKLLQKLHADGLLSNPKYGEYGVPPLGEPVEPIEPVEPTSTTSTTSTDPFQGMNEMGAA